MKFEELVLHYGVLAGRRYTEKEKLEFLANFQNEFTKLGYKTQILKKDYKRFSGHNCYIGDVVNAKNIIIAHYDTPLNSLDDNIRYQPFNNKLNEKLISDKPKMRALRVIILFMFVMFFVMFYLKVEQPYLNIILIALTTIMTVVAYYFLKGSPNPTNANLNTSGLLATLELAKLKLDNTAYILTDRECIDNLGDVMVTEALPKTLNSKNFIHLKAIGNGENIVIGFKKNNRKLAQSIRNKNQDIVLFELNDEFALNHSLNYYPNAVSITVADEFNGNYEIKNVANDKDLVINKEKFDIIVKLIENHVKSN